MKKKLRIVEPIIFRQRPQPVIEIDDREPDHVQIWMKNRYPEDSGEMRHEVIMINRAKLPEFIKLLQGLRTTTDEFRRFKGEDRRIFDKVNN